MIKLENVSTIRLIDYASMKSYIESWYFVYKILMMYNIDDYQKLEDLINGNNDLKKMLGLQHDKVMSVLKYELDDVLREMRKEKNLGKEACVYEFNRYNDCDIDKETLSITDKSNNGDVLLYTSPISRGGIRINTLKYNSIDELKHLASHLDSYRLDNALSCKRNFGIDTVKKVVDRINFYEKQVIRQGMDTTDRGVNLFLVNKKEKDEIVESQLKEIVEYILDNANECVWGILSDTQKMQMMRAVSARWGEYILQDRNKIIDMISNYTTLSELKADVVKKKTLNRFIVR